FLCCSLFILTLYLCASATTRIYTLSLHDALPISGVVEVCCVPPLANADQPKLQIAAVTRYLLQRETVSDEYGISEGGLGNSLARSEEHTSELQSRENLVCRLLLEKKKKKEYK